MTIAMRHPVQINDDRKKSVRSFVNDDRHF